MRLYGLGSGTLVDLDALDVCRVFRLSQSIEILTVNGRSTIMTRRWNVALNIKNAAAEKLAREVARATGETLTDAVVHALEDRLARLRARRFADAEREAIDRICREFAKLPELDRRTPDEILGYDEDGAFGR